MAEERQQPQPQPEPQEQQQQRDAPADAQAEAEAREARDFWGHLFSEDKSATELLSRLLTGIFNYIGGNFVPSDTPDIAPAQLAAFYRAVGGDYDVLFKDTPPSTIAFIYSSLGCLYSLQPAPGNDGFSYPTIPALKKKGFITWQTIQLLLGPEEHVPFLQEAVRQFDIIDPSTGGIFPNVLPKDAFPDKPDADMLAWYESVSERLRQEAESEEQGRPQKQKTGGRDHSARDDPGPHSSSETSLDGDEKRAGAARYFRNPTFKDRQGRPATMGRYSKHPRSPREAMQDKGWMFNTVKHFWSPRARPNADGESFGNGNPPANLHPRYTHRRPPRRGNSLSSTDSEPGATQRSRGPMLRHHRSHEAPLSPREYFPAPFDVGRRHSSEYRRSDHAYRSSNPPLFVAHAAHVPPPVYYDRRPTISAREPYLRGSVRYSSPSSMAWSPEGPLVGERYGYGSRASSRGPSRSRERERDVSREWGRSGHRYVTPVMPVEGVHGRRYPIEAPWR